MRKFLVRRQLEQIFNYRRYRIAELLLGSPCDRIDRGIPVEFPAQIGQLKAMCSDDRDQPESITWLPVATITSLCL